MDCGRTEVGRKTLVPFTIIKIRKKRILRKELELGVRDENAKRRTKENAKTGGDTYARFVVTVSVWDRYAGTRRVRFRGLAEKSGHEDLASITAFAYGLWR